MNGLYQVPRTNPYDDTPEEEVNDDMSQGDDFTEAFLQHYGVKGMKWGVRRSRAERQAAARGEQLAFKRMDSSPSKKAPKGEQLAFKRMDYPSPNMKPRARRKAADALDPSQDVQEFVRIGSKVGTKGNTKALSNSELKSLNERMRLEREFSQLSGERQTSVGSKFIRDVGGNVMKQQANRTANNVVGGQIDKMLKNMNK